MAINSGGKTVALLIEQAERSASLNGQLRTFSLPSVKDQFLRGVLPAGRAAATCQTSYARLGGPARTPDERQHRQSNDAQCDQLLPIHLPQNSLNRPLRNRDLAAYCVPMPTL
jgi:hypothetical protein